MLPQAALNGWEYITPPPLLLETALERCKAMDAQADLTRPGRVHSHARQDERASGMVAETIFEAWLQHKQARYVRHGGNDGYPDFEVEGHGVALRCCGSRVPFRESHLVYVFDAHLHKFQHWFFFGYERGSGSFILLGGSSAVDYHAHAMYADTGATIVPGFTCSAPLWYTRCNQLTPPGEWLNALRSEAAQARP
ncbi:MAG TPA: hypothetical protein VGF24_37280 [Vicinamibacterales bacterium]|jgi:hypothetical protein